MCAQRNKMASIFNSDQFNESLVVREQMSAFDHLIQGYTSWKHEFEKTGESTSARNTGLQILTKNPRPLPRPESVPPANKLRPNPG